jgi:arginine kinase
MACQKVSLTQKYLPKDVWNWLSKKTSYGTTIYDCVVSGMFLIFFVSDFVYVDYFLLLIAIENPDSNCGLYAPDPEAYDVFAELFHPVIAEYHKVDIATLKSIHDLGDANNLEDLPPHFAENIVSTRVRVGRTVKGFPMARKLLRDVSLIFIISLFSQSYAYI